MSPPPPESLTIRPPAAAWRSLVRHNTTPDAVLIRRELGLATDRPIIMTGHQAEFWHPGILAKYLAADAASIALNAQPAWLVVDQDRAESTTLRFPTQTNNQLTAATATITAQKVQAPPTTLADIQPHLQHLITTYQQQPAAPLPQRIAATLAALMRPYLSEPAPTLFATELWRTTLFQTLITKMQQDPEACITAYNAAARNHPSAGIRPLIADDIQDRWELPLWHLPPGKKRTHVYAEMLSSVPISELAPKALFMTGLMRLAACDLFIHGTGGGGAGGEESHEGYDLITEEWLKQWLGAARLAPMAVVTATRYLPLSTQPPPSADQVARADAAAHRARHSPELLGDHAGEVRKQSLVHAIAAAPRHSHLRADTFHEMHRLLDTVRRTHASALEELDQAAEHLKARWAERDIVFNRTWPFALYPAESLHSLGSQIHNEFGNRINA